MLVLLSLLLRLLRLWSITLGHILINGRTLVGLWLVSLVLVGSWVTSRETSVIDLIINSRLRSLCRVCYWRSRKDDAHTLQCRVDLSASITKVVNLAVRVSEEYAIETYAVALVTLTVNDIDAQLHQYLSTWCWLAFEDKLVILILSWVGLEVVRQVLGLIDGTIVQLAGRLTGLRDVELLRNNTLSGSLRVSILFLAFLICLLL